MLIALVGIFVRIGRLLAELEESRKAQTALAQAFSDFKGAVYERFDQLGASEQRLVERIVKLEVQVEQLLERRSA